MMGPASVVFSLPVAHDYIARNSNCGALVTHYKSLHVGLPDRAVPSKRNMPRCAFLTLENTAGWFIDDDLVHEPLRTLGWEVDNVPWTSPADWNAYDLVVIRSPWDYQQRPDEFFEVLKQIDRSQALLQNSVETVQWNINKNYLLELEAQALDWFPR